MSKVTKIKEGELKQLQILNAKEQGIYHDLGVLSAQSHELLHALSYLKQEFSEAKKQIEISYGKINLNIQTGEYTELEEEVEQAIE